MTQVSSKLSVAQATDPVIAASAVRRLAGASLILPRSEFDLAVAEDRARIVSFGGTAGIYQAGQLFQIVGEAGVRSWLIGIGADNASIAAASHARTVILPSGASVVLAGDANVVIPVSGAPGNGIGAIGDLAIDVAGSNYYTKTGTAVWSAPTAIFPGVGGAGGSALPTIVAFSTTIPLDGVKVMTASPRDIVGPTVFNAGATKVAGAQCVVKLAANGTNTPTFPGMTEWGGSAGWINAVGTINTITFWYDGGTVYFSVMQNGSAPLTIPVPVAAVKATVGANPQVSVSFSAALGTPVPEAAKLTLTTTPAAGGTVTETMTAIAVAGSTLTLQPSRPVTAGDVSLLSYDPSQGLLANRMVDTAGNPLFGWQGLSIIVSSFLGALDGFANTPSIALSVSRRLLSSYTGPIIQVATVNSGGTPVDIGFDASGNITGLPGGTIYLHKLYDQSGNGRHFTFGGSIFRPAMVPITVAGQTRYVVLPNNTTFTASFVPNGTFVSSTGNGSLSGVFAVPSGATARWMFDSASGATVNTSRMFAVNTTFGWDGGYAGGTPTWTKTTFEGETTLHQLSNLREPTQSTLIVDNATIGVVTGLSGNVYTAQTAAENHFLFCQLSGGLQWTAQFGELIFFPSLMSGASRTALSANQKAYFGTP